MSTRNRRGKAVLKSIVPAAIVQASCGLTSLSSFVNDVNAVTTPVTLLRVRSLNPQSNTTAKSKAAHGREGRITEANGDLLALDTPMGAHVAPVEIGGSGQRRHHGVGCELLLEQLLLLLLESFNLTLNRDLIWLNRQSKGPGWEGCPAIPVRPSTETLRQVHLASGDANWAGVARAAGQLEGTGILHPRRQSQKQD